MSSSEIFATLEHYAHAYCAKDIDSLMSVFDTSDDISAIGTGADEICEGPTQVKELFLRNFKEAQANRFEWHWSHCSITGDSAVVAVTLTIHLEVHGNRLKVPLRWTVALRKKGNRWVWIHRHASTPALNQDDGQAYPDDRS